MLSLLANTILEKHPNKNFEDTFEECKSMFNRENCYNIYDLNKHFAHIYELDEKNLSNELNALLADTKDFLYPDSVPFLERLKSEGHQLYIFSFCKESLKYQSAKISGSGIADYFEALFITSVDKHNLDVKYEEGVFIDDNVDVLKGLYGRKPKQVIRIARHGCKYSSQELDIPEIKSYNSFSEIESL